MQRRRFLRRLGVATVGLAGAGCSRPAGVPGPDRPSATATATTAAGRATTVPGRDVGSRDDVVAWHTAGDWESATVRRGVASDGGTLTVAAVDDGFDDGSLGEWSAVEGRWRERNGAVENVSNGVQDTLLRPARNAYGTWTLEHEHGSAGSGAVVLVAPSGFDGPGVPSSSYFLLLSGERDGYRRVLARGAGDATIPILDLGRVDGDRHTYRIERDDEGVFTGFVDGERVDRGQDGTFTTSGAVGFVAGRSGHRWHAFGGLDTAATLRTAPKSFPSAVRPDLEFLAYRTNGGRVGVTVVGSPGTDSEERVSVPLTGGSGRRIANAWAISHTAFSVEIRLRAASPSQLPTVSSVALVAGR